MARIRRSVWFGILVLGIVAALGIALWLTRPRWSEERVRDTIVSTIQSESPASDLVTGRVRIAAQREIHDLGQFSWLPAWLDLPGVNFLDAQTRVEVTGEALYGFDVRALRPEMIAVRPDGLVEVTLPPLHVIAVDTDLGTLRLQSEEGVFRSGSGRELEQEALADLQVVLREQAERHLDTSVQPGMNTARALRALLTPPLQAVGLEDPQFTFRVAPDLILTPQSE